VEIDSDWNFYTAWFTISLFQIMFLIVKIGTIILSLVLLLTFEAHASSIQELFQKVQSASCSTISDQKYSVSIQVSTAFNTASMLLKVKDKAWKSYQCSAQKVGLVIYEFESENEKKSALGYFQGLIWGAGGRTPHHPERIYSTDKQVVIVSSKKLSSIDALFSKKQQRKESMDWVAKYVSGSACNTTNQELCLIAKNFKSGEQVSFPKHYYFTVGKFIIVNARTSRQTKRNLILLTNTAEGKLYGDVFDPNPANAQEEKSIDEYQAQLVLGKRDTQNPIHVYVTSLFGKRKLNPIIVKYNTHFLKFKDLKTSNTYHIWLRRNGDKIYGIGEVIDSNGVASRYFSSSPFNFI
jgi:hypothetical protein